MTAVLDVTHLQVGYEGSRVLADVDFAIGAGEVVALMGANGSGKSTLVKSILGIVEPTGGQVRLFGQPSTKRRAVPWQRLGYVPQRLTATSGVPATALETVSEGLLGHRRLRVRRGEARRRSSVALESVGLADRAGAAVHELSGGQQQRVLMARALVREPDLLVLDEPLAGMDQPSQDRTRRLLAERVAQGTTVLVVLHEVDPLADLITRALVLRHGRIVHDGDVPRSAPGHTGHQHDHVHPHEDYEPYVPHPELRIEP